jgi:hypothetical protein
MNNHQGTFTMNNMNPASHVRKLDFRTTPAFKQSMVKEEKQYQYPLETSECLSSKITMQERIIVKKNP